MNVDKILEIAPAKIAEYSERENEAYGKMLQLHEQYKRERARKYLERRAREGQVTIKDIEYELDTDGELLAIKDGELLAEISYRSFRAKKEKARDYFTAACESGRNARSELYGLNDTVKKEA